MTTQRRPEELSVLATGVQNLAARFGKRRRLDNDDLPPVSPWRCNLTGLSREQNLYFVAYGRDIYVYVPQWPRQAVDRHPALIVPSQPSSPNLRGYIDRQEPHTINNLVVQRLGNDEVVATVRDDGDVDVVLVRHIVQAIERRAEPKGAIAGLADEVKPIFQSNVGISAWGLAIHTGGRILAVSSNAHEVRVFKFGLMREDEDDALLGDARRRDASSEEGVTSTGVGSDHEHDVRRPLNDSRAFCDQRRTDVTETVLNGNANIPHISFCNTGDDPEARWLLTTDIEGYCRVMDLHAVQDADVASQVFRFGGSVPGIIPGLDRYNAGWAIMFLDPRSFQPESDFHTALGMQEGQSLPGGEANKSTWDLSDTIQNVPEVSEAFVYVRPEQRRRRHRPPENGTGGVLQSPRSDETIEAIEANEARQHHSFSRDDGVDVLGGLTSELAELGEDMESPSEDETQESSEDPHNDRYNDDRDENMDDAASNLLSDDTSLVGDDYDPDDEGTEDSVTFSSMYSGRRIFGNQPIFSDTSGLLAKLPCPILHASVHNIYLLQPSLHHPPMLGLANPLRQSLHTGLEFLNHFDRLNMHAYIPRLGVLVLASQKGRAVVLELTKLRKNAARAKRSCFAMRVVRILPLEGQERRGERPGVPLHGVAAGPVQGGRGRWRLMMMYQDHSILSYEISRKEEVGVVI